MISLKGDNVQLRALEPQDLNFVFKLENNEAFWEISNTQIPFSKYTIELYLQNVHRDIYDVKQLRLVIEVKNEPIGLIDLFDFDPRNGRAGVGIIIEAKENRGKGYGLDGLSVLKKYAFKHLHLHQLFANISADNEASIIMFENAGFEQVGIKKDWNLINASYKDEILYQLINKNVH